MSKGHASLSSIVISGRASAPPVATEQWLLNLDQIESHTGKVTNWHKVPNGSIPSSSFYFTEGTVLYSKLRPYLNKVVVADRSGVATTELVPLVLDTGRADPSYVAHFLRSPKFLAFATNVVAGAKMPRMVMSEFWKYEIPLPSLSEQSRIAAILDKADALRAKRREAITKLDQLLQAVFLDMFGDPKTNPKGWLVAELGTLILDGPQNGIYKPSSKYGSGTPIVRIDSFRAGDVIQNLPEKRVRLTDAEVAKYRLRPDDLVINRVNSPEHLGKPSLVGRLCEPTVFESNMMRVSLDAKRVSPAFLLNFLLQQHVRDQITRRRKDAINQSSINQTDVCTLAINLPPIQLQGRFSAVVSAIARLHQRNGANASKVNLMFDSLSSSFFG